MITSSQGQVHMSTQVEMVALAAAFYYIASHFLGCTVQLYSEVKSSLNYLSSSACRSTMPDSHQILRIAFQAKTEIVDAFLLHVTGHQTIRQNEKVDTHGKQTVRSAKYVEVNQDISSCKGLSRDFHYHTSKPGYQR
jgi:hypothetical protein